MPAAREPFLADPRTSHAVNSPAFFTIQLAVLTLIGAWLRLSHLGSKSLWLDEGATVALARTSWQHFAWVWWHGEANLQTVYFLLMRGWIHFGDSEAWLRLPSALFGIASVPLLYAVARKFMGGTAAMAAAALLAFSPTHVYYSQEARSYTLAILVVLLSTYYFVRAVERNHRGNWLLWALFGVLAFYTHDFTALVLVAQAASLLFLPKPAPWRPMLLCGALIFLAAIPGLTYVFRASPENLHFIWMPRPSGKEFWHLAMFFGGGGAKAVIALALWIAGVVAIWRSRHSGIQAAFWRGMLIIAWAVLPPVILALLSLRQPMFLQRYVIFSLPALLLLAAMGEEILHKWKLGLLLVVALIAMSIPAIRKDYYKPREDWRGASNAVLAAAAPGDAVVFFPFYTRVMMDYYRDRHGAGAPPLHIFAPPYYATGEDARDLLRALGKNPRAYSRVWILVADHTAALQNFDQGASVAEKLRSIYGTPTLQKFAGVDVLEYGR